MNGENKVPWSGMLLALLTLVGLVMTHVNLALVAVTGLSWLFSLWVEWLRPAPTAVISKPAERISPEAVTKAAMISAIEPIGLPLLLLDNHRIIAANAQARDTLGAHIAGQDARIALRHPDAVRLLTMPDGRSVTIRGLTGTGSLWQLTRRRINDRYWSIEMHNRTAEADMGRAHTDFVANASHELRTPLSSIIGYVETLADDPGRVDADTTKRFLGTVLREARRMQSLVADLMSLSQLEAEKHDAPTEHIDLAQMAARVVGEFAPPQSRRLEYAKPDCQIAVAGDAKQLEQLLRNLIDNALKYGDDDKPVSISLGLGDRGQAMMCVADRGAGIAAVHLPHLTRRFYRTDPGRSRAAGGTGLGLAIVKHIVERHRGKLDISSQQGEGTQVTVRLPRVDARKTDTVGGGPALPASQAAAAQNSDNMS